MGVFSRLWGMYKRRTTKKITLSLDILRPSVINTLVPVTDLDVFPRFFIDFGGFYG